MMNGGWPRILLAIAAGVFGCSVFSYVEAACKNDCRTAVTLTTPLNSCRVFVDSATGMQTSHAWNLVKTYNLANTEKQPANLTGVTLNVYSPKCYWTCAASEQPQEAQALAQKINPQADIEQRKCTGGS